MDEKVRAAVEDLASFAEDHAGDVFDDERWEEALDAINESITTVRVFLNTTPSA